MLAQWLGKGEGRGDGFESLSTDISNKTKQLTFAHKKKKPRKVASSSNLVKDAVQYRVGGVLLPCPARQGGGKPMQNGTVPQTTYRRSVARNDEAPFPRRASEDEPEKGWKTEIRLMSNL